MSRHELQEGQGGQTSLSREAQTIGDAVPNLALMFRGRNRFFAAYLHTSGGLTLLKVKPYDSCLISSEVCLVFFKAGLAMIGQSNVLHHQQKLMGYTDPTYSKQQFRRPPFMKKVIQNLKRSKGG